MMQTESTSANDNSSFTATNVSGGCCAGSCLGSLLQFGIFVLAVTKAARHHTHIPYTETDVFVAVLSGCFIGASIGTFLWPLFVGFCKRRRENR